MSVIANRPQKVSIEDLAQENREILSLGEAIELVEERDEDREFLKAEKVFWERLKELPEEAYEERGTAYYYLLRINIQASKLFESEKIRNLYEQMHACFREQFKIYRAKMRANRQDNLVRLQYNAFLKLAERYFFALELLYRKKDWFDSAQNSYGEKMFYRQMRFAFEGRYLEYIFYKFLEISSLYGESFWRWGLVSVLVIFAYGGIYAGLDYAETGGAVVRNGGFWDYFYFSAVNFTTLGYGDILPVTLTQKFLVAVEAVSGYLMLGSFMALLNKKMH